MKKTILVIDACVRQEESTILLLTGQLTAGILFDAFMFHNINLKKLLGILLVAAGIIWDNKISHMPEK